MKLQTMLATVASVLIGASLAAPQLQARTCSGNGDIVGSYGFTASRAGFFLLGATAPGTNSGPLVPVPVTPPGTSGAAVVGSNTPIGNLVSGLLNRNSFSVVGRMFADGMGNLFAANSNGVLLTNVLVGTYVVTPDCAVTMTVGDPFSTTTTTPIGGVFGAPGVNLGSHTVNLEGVIVDSGNSSEIHLVVTNAGGAGATVTMVKTSQFSSCTNASIFGNYAVSGQGMVTSATATGTTTGGGLTGGGGVTTTGTTGTAGAFTSGVAGSLGTPFLLLGRTVADGAGNLVTDFSSTNATVKRAITGTYTVNADCTGTARLQDTSGVARNISFVLVNEAAACSNGLQTGARQSLQFVFTDPGVIGSGEARQQ